MTGPKPTPPKPGAPKPPSPAQVAKRASHPVKVPVVASVTDEQVVAASAFGDVTDGVVSVKDGDATREVGPAQGDTPMLAFIKAYYELAASVERFHARLASAELSPRDIDDALGAIDKDMTEPAVVGDLATLRERVEQVRAEALEARERIAAARKQAREAAAAERERIVVDAEAIAAKDIPQIHWKNDTTQLRALLDEWKEAQRSGARIPKDVERALWKRFTAARNSFEKARKHHFADLDRENSEVSDRKDALIARAETLSTSTDWDRTARAFKDLMGEWRQAGRGRRSTDDAQWARFQAAQDAFFEARRADAEAEDAALEGNVEAKEAAVVEAEALLPIKDLRQSKEAMRAIQDRFEAAGRVPRAKAATLTKRMAAVERAVREAEESEWDRRNPELEARASGAAAQLQSAIADLEAELAEATKAGDKRAIASVTEALEARRAWLAQIEGVVS